MSMGSSAPKAAKPYGAKSERCPGCGEPLEQYVGGKFIHHVPPGRHELAKTIEVGMSDVFEGCKSARPTLVAKP